MMKREIKFRAITLNGELVYGVTNLNALSIVKESIEQFTGLHDKNGKEIYEGDIVKSNWNNSARKYIGQNYEIKFGKWWHSGGFEDSYGGIGFYAQPTIGDEYYIDSEMRSADNIPCDRNDDNYYDVVVIGNIHENVEE